MNPFLATDGYKVDHHRQYPQGTTLVYSNFTPRAAKHAPKGVNKDYIISFGQQMVMRQIEEMFDKNFFKRDDISDSYNMFKNIINKELTTSQTLKIKNKIKSEVCQEIKKEYSTYLGVDYDVSHIEALWDLGYLPIKVKALPEGTKVPIGVPVLTIVNTKPEFFWLTNFLETLISNLLWKPMTSATIAYNYRQNLMSWAEKTDKEYVGFVDFQGHDFSMRGMDSVDATISSGLGHATSFLGSDSLPVIHGARKYYDEEGMVIAGVPATEHSVMCAGSKDDEVGTFRRLLNLYPEGLLSVVSDTWDLWKVITEYLPELKDEILARHGKLVIRPDSGDPVDIICGKIKHSFSSIRDLGYFFSKVLEMECNTKIYFTYNDEVYSVKQSRLQEFMEEYGRDQMFEFNEEYTKFSDIVYGGSYSYIKKEETSISESKGVIELLWDIFGGTTNEQGYKVLDSHIGAIYGDSITLARAEEICERLEAKGFASTNVVLGIGSFTYQFNTRDTFGFAMKATYVEVTEDGNYMNAEGREIFKDPITDDGTKKSAKGLLKVERNGDSLILVDQINWTEEAFGQLQTIFQDGEFSNETTLTEIRNKLKN